MRQNNTPSGHARGYGRASTDEQEDTLVDQSARVQLEYEKTFAPQGWTWGGMYVDKGISGGIPLVQRPQGYQLCLALEPGDVVIVTHLDRAFRNTADLCRMLDTWDAKSIRLVLMDLNLDTGTPVGRAAVQMMGVFGEFEKNMAGERTRAVMESRRKRGLPTGGQHPPYGYKRVGAKGSRRYVPNPEQRDLGRLIVRWMDSGQSIDQVHNHLLANNIKNPNTLETIGRPSIWRYYCWEKQLQAMEEMRESEGGK